MDVSFLCRVLEGTLSADNNVRKAAEVQLKQVGNWEQGETLTTLGKSLCSWRMAPHIELFIKSKRILKPLRIPAACEHTGLHLNFAEVDPSAGVSCIRLVGTALGNALRRLS